MVGRGIALLAGVLLTTGIAIGPAGATPKPPRPPDAKLIAPYA
jgi:hypothetical protein